jgi:hypothetical protein
MAVFLVNVGVNSSHSVNSPIYKDGTFKFVTIPEEKNGNLPMLKYSGVPYFKEIIPEKWKEKFVHLDPDFISEVITYGDNCSRVLRAINLQKAKKEDLLLFVARLEKENKEPGFYIVGQLEIQEILKNVTKDPGVGWWDNNAHIRRGRAVGEWNEFWVFKGGRNSGLYKRAIKFDKKVAMKIFGKTWTWKKRVTDLQTIGSYTRTIKMTTNDTELKLRQLIKNSLEIGSIREMEF